MEKEENLSKSQVFYLLKNEPDKIKLDPNPLYAGGELDEMKNRVLVEKNGTFVRTAFHLCNKCPKTSLNRLIKVKTAVRFCLLSHAKTHEKIKPTKNPISDHFPSNIQIPVNKLLKYHRAVTLAMATGNLPISFFTTESCTGIFRAIAGML